MIIFKIVLGFTSLIIVTIKFIRIVWKMGLLCPKSMMASSHCLKMKICEWLIGSSFESDMWTYYNKEPIFYFNVDGTLDVMI